MYVTRGNSYIPEECKELPKSHINALGNDIVVLKFYNYATLVYAATTLQGSLHLNISYFLNYQILPLHSADK